MLTRLYTKVSLWLCQARKDFGNTHQLASQTVPGAFSEIKYTNMTNERACVCEYVLPLSCPGPCACSLPRALLYSLLFVLPWRKLKRTRYFVWLQWVFVSSVDSQDGVLLCLKISLPPSFTPVLVLYVSLSPPPSFPRSRIHVSLSFYFSLSLFSIMLLQPPFRLFLNSCLSEHWFKIRFFYAGEKNKCSN